MIIAIWTTTITVLFIRRTERLIWKKLLLFSYITLLQLSVISFVVFICCYFYCGLFLCACYLWNRNGWDVFVLLSVLHCMCCVSLPILSNARILDCSGIICGSHWFAISKQNIDYLAWRQKSALFPGLRNNGAGPENFIFNMQWNPQYFMKLKDFFTTALYCIISFKYNEEKKLC